MDYQTWKETVSLQCPRAVNVRGGAMCFYKEGRKNYCDYNTCPKIKDDVLK